MSKRKTQKTIQYGDITYTLSLRKLGSGGNGAVYEITDLPQGFKAISKKLNLPLAIKILCQRKNENLKRQEEKIKRFKDEINVLQSLTDKTIDDKPIVVPIFIYNIDDDAPWYIMPKLKSLEEIKFGIKDIGTIDILISLATSLKELHSLGYAHRDIKPSNILLTENNHPLWADFGLVKYEEKEIITEENRAIGPKNYISNEVGHPYAAMTTVEGYQKSDVKSFSKLIFAILTQGKIPMEGVYSQFLSAFEDKGCEDILNPILNCLTQGGELVPDTRCSLDDIISNLKRFKSLLQSIDMIPKLDIQNFALERTVKSFCSKTKPTYYSYEGAGIISFFKDLQKTIKNTFNITFSRKGTELTYKCNGLHIDKGLYYFYYRLEKRNDIFYFNPSLIKIYQEEKFEIETSSYPSQYGVKQKLGLPFSSEETIVIIERSTIIINYANNVYETSPEIFM